MREIHFKNGDIWKWKVGRKYVEIRSPDGKKSCPLKHESISKTEEQYHKDATFYRCECCDEYDSSIGTDERQEYFDTEWSDNSITPGKIKIYIQENLL